MKINSNVNKLTIQQFDRLCRFCLKYTDPTLKSIFCEELEKNLQNEQSVELDIKAETVVEIIQSITNVKMKIDDDFPKLMCENCSNSIKSITKFRRRCLNSFAILEEIQNKSHTTRESIVESVVENKITESPVLQTSFYKTKTKKYKTKLPCKNFEFPAETGNSKCNLIKQREKGKYKKVCEICGKKTYFMPDHMVKHSDERPFPCTICDKRFKQKTVLDRHLAIHLDIRKYKCQLCERDFVDVSSYNNHKLWHAGEKNQVCSICGARFILRTGLKRHMDTHTQIRKHECPQCKKKFVTPGCLKRHLKTHTGEKPYKCQYCDKYFSARESRKLHQRNFHSDVILETKT